MPMRFSWMCRAIDTTPSGANRVLIRSHGFKRGLLKRGKLFNLRSNNMSIPNENTPAPAAPSDFIRDIVAAQVSEHKYPRIHTRFRSEERRVGKERRFRCRRY